MCCLIVKKAAVGAIALERVVAGEYNEFFGIACRHIPELLHQFFFRLTLTVGFNLRLVVRMQPPLAVENDDGNIVAKLHFFRPGAPIHGVETDIGFVHRKEIHV